LIFFSNSYLVVRNWLVVLRWVVQRLWVKLVLDWDWTWWCC